MVEGAGLEVPDLVGMVEEPVAHELVIPRQQPDQVHLLGHEEFEIKSHTILNHPKHNGSPLELPQWQCRPESPARTVPRSPP